MDSLDRVDLQAELKTKKICRFCLCQDYGKLINIFMQDTRVKSSVPLPIQTLAIASIEVFIDDDMPSYACSDCTNTFEFTFQFKQMCKKADSLLRQFPLTGEWPDTLDKPALMTNQFLQGALATPNIPEHTGKTSIEHESLLLSKKVPSSSASSSTAIISSDISSQSESDVDDNIFFGKIGNNELSLNHTRQLAAAENVSESGYVERDNVTVEIVSENQTYKPKLLNKSSIRNLNKEAEPEIGPCLTLPKVNKGMDSKTETVDDVQLSEKPYKCSVCDQAFTHSTMLAHHEKTHMDVPKYVCVHCNQSFLLKEDMEKHVKIHKNLRIACKFCSKKFAYKNSLYRHEAIHEGEADPITTVIETNIFPCSYCELSFPLLQLRDIHMKDHSYERPNDKFQCEHCEKSFGVKYQLEVHSTLHTGKRPFKCSVCDATFSHKSYLALHGKIHNDVPNYKCRHCERSFLLKKDMENHVERHQKKVFLCKVCNTSFSSKQYLAVHQRRRHSRQQPYTCQYCGKCFQYKCLLSDHVKERTCRRS